MVTPLLRRIITRASFGRDLTDKQSLSVDSNILIPPHQDSATIRILTNKSLPRLSFLKLPTEIRLYIYDLLLVSRSNRKQTPSWAVGNTCQRMITLHTPNQIPQYRTIELSILSTCTQIYREAISTLYSANVFNFSEPDQMFRFMTQIGPTNTKFVRSLDIWVPYIAELSPWLTLLNTLSKEATGVRFIELAWGANCESSLMRERGAKERGLGDNVLFVCALAGIQGLEKIHLKGYYATHWPSYLVAVTGARVQAECGQRHEPGPDDDAATIQLIQDANERSLWRFRDYQRGTEDLVP